MISLPEEKEPVEKTQDKRRRTVCLIKQPEFTCEPPIFYMDVYGLSRNILGDRTASVIFFPHAAAMNASSPT
jgi:hypothetical protein